MVGCSAAADLCGWRGLCKAFGSMHSGRLSTWADAFGLIVVELAACKLGCVVDASSVKLSVPASCGASSTFPCSQGACGRRWLPVWKCAGDGWVSGCCSCWSAGYL